MKKVIIIGAGISGCSLANLLANNSYQVDIYEKQNHLGGHCYDLLSKDKIMYHKYGPHIFHTEHDEVIKFITQFAKFNGYINKVQVKLPNKITTRLPFNFSEIKKMDLKNGNEIVAYLKEKFPNKPKISILELRKFRDYKPLNKIVDWVYDNVYAPYTAKMWGIDIKDIDESVIARVGITLSENESYFPTAKIQGLPIGGYTKMMYKMIDHPNINLHLNVNAFDYLKIAKNQIYWNKSICNDLIVYCGPIEALLDYKYGVLPYRSLEFKFQTFNTKRKQKFPIINLPKDKAKTRTVEYKQMTKQKCEKTIISTEYPGAFDINGKKWNLPYYPINNKKNNELYNKYYNELKKIKNLYLLGRLAEYKYLDMDTSILSAINMSKKINKML
ncbi:UDP-galactopyranose mutase [Mycoplasmoides alvi]|uniref:UDP-galactopyranose mutase n=1 Tax=Mycoplasmoides alvi TaxID=78580 RepID=UPI00051C043D|nr:UDP-galactopyranose mutase [Mycoplasmoides alvi]